DQFNNTVTSFNASTDSVTISALSPLTGTVSGIHGSNVLNQAGDFSSGVADLTALGLKYTGNATTGKFRATSTTGKTGDSGNVTISAGTATKIVLSASASGNLTSGTTRDLTATVEDASGNTVDSS